MSTSKAYNIFSCTINTYITTPLVRYSLNWKMKQKNISTLFIQFARPTSDEKRFECHLWYATPSVSYYHALSLPRAKRDSLPLTLFYYVLLEMRYYMGIKMNSLTKSIKTIETWWKCMLWQKWIIFALDSCIRRVIGTFLTSTGPKKKCFFTRIVDGYIRFIGKKFSI